LLTKASEKQIKYILENSFSVEDERLVTMDGKVSFWRGIKLNKLGQGEQEGQGFSSPIGIKNLTIGSNTMSSLSSLSKTFKCLKSTSFMIDLGKEIKLKVGKTYNQDILGEDSEKSMEILELDDKIEVII